MENRHKSFSISVAEHASFSHQARTLKTNLLRFDIKCYFNTGTFCLLFLSSHVFTALEFNSHHFGILLWKMAKSCDLNEILIKQPSRKIFQKYKPVRQYLSFSFVNKVFDSCNKVSYLQKNQSCYNLETTFQKKFRFSQ